MKKVSFLLCLILLFLGFLGTANASLTVVGDGAYVYDDDSEIWWWADLTTFIPEGAIPINTYDNQMSYIQNMGGGWSMASDAEMTGLSLNDPQAVVDGFTPNDSNENRDFYSGRYDSTMGLEVGQHAFAVIQHTAEGDINVLTGGVSDSAVSPQISAWVFTATNPVPIPGAVWLLGSGLIGVVGFRKKFKE